RNPGQRRLNRTDREGVCGKYAGTRQGPHRLRPFQHLGSSVRPVSGCLPPTYRKGGDFVGAYLQLLDLNVPPVDLDPATIVDLQRNAAGSLSDLIVFKTDHGFPVQPGLDHPADNPDFHRVPVAIFQRFVFLRLGLNQPSASIRFVDPAGIMTRRRYFRLPAGYLGSLDARTEENAAVAIGFLFEFSGKFKIAKLFVGREVSVFFVRTALRYQQPILNIPFLGTVDLPAGEV